MWRAMIRKRWVSKKLKEETEREEKREGKKFDVEHKKVKRTGIMRVRRRMRRRKRKRLVR